MLSWLYDIFLAIVSFVMSFFGVELNKKSVTFASDVKEEEEKKEDELVTPKGEDLAVANATPLAE
jgi:hypothetical protein